ncbi:Serine/arginine-rich splicing factor 3 [Taenia crassiceps]|uniref:Serine/arginine-rich splicing factor 3 n=1 Tax=Taenia crassiceps TaxID=6207 RepID=A0ABR4Q6A8_9CEST
MSGGLSSNVSKSDLLRELSKFGSVLDLWIARNPPGFAFVQFEKFVDAEKAVRALDGVTLCDSKLRVEFAHNRSRDGDRSRPFGDRRQYIDSRGSRMSSVRRYEASLHRGRSPPPGILSVDQFRYSYDRLAAFYNSSMVNAAAAAAAASFPYRVSGHSSMFPLLPAEDVNRVMKHSRRISPRRSPMHHRRSRSPMDSRSQNTYDRYREVYRGRDRRRPSLLFSRRGTQPPPFSFTSSSQFGSRQYHYCRSPLHLRESERRRR